MGSCGGVLILTKNCSLNSEIKLKEFSLLYVKFVLCYNNCRIYNALVKDTRKYHLERNRFSQIPCKNERSVVFDDLNYSNSDWQCFTRPGSDGAFYVFKISLIQLVDGLLHKLVITNSNKTNLREVNKNYFSPPLHFGDNQWYHARDESVREQKTLYYSFSPAEIESLRLCSAQSVCSSTMAMMILFVIGFLAFLTSTKSYIQNVLGGNSFLRFIRTTSIYWVGLKLIASNG